MALNGPKLPYRGQQLKDLSGTSREDLEALVKGLVEGGIASAEAVNNELDQIRFTSGQSAKRASMISRGLTLIFGSPEKKLLGKLEEDYERQAQDLCTTGQANESMFSRLQIIEALTPEVLSKALQIEKLGKGATVKGLLIPDNNRYKKSAVINDYQIPGLKWNMVFEDADNKDLWNGGQEWPAYGQWQYKLFQGEQDVADDSNIRGAEFKRSKEWVAKIEKAGLEVLTGADSYLAAMRQALVSGKRLDANTYTVLNGKNLIKTSRMASGHCSDEQVCLESNDPAKTNIYLRARAVIAVDVPKVSL